MATKWYLGVSGLMLDGKGFGIESVEAGSPAEAAGLATGMVITKVNGVEILDTATLAEAIATSVDGLLELEVIVEAGAEPVPATVQMTRIEVASF